MKWRDDENRSSMSNSTFTSAAKVVDSGKTGSLDGADCWYYPGENGPMFRVENYNFGKWNYGTWQYVDYKS
jgi:hypothetical protein